MSESKHPLAGGIFLVGAIGLIGFGAYSGIHSAGGHGTSAEAARALDVNAQVVEAIQLGQSGDVDGAAVRLRAIVSQHPENLDAIYNLGVALIGTGDGVEAERMFRRVLELAPDDGDALAELAGLKKDANDLDAAFALLEQIKVGDEKIRLRLLEDPLWQEVESDPRMKALLEKHNISKRPVDAVPPSGEPIR